MRLPYNRNLYVPAARPEADPMVAQVQILRDGLNLLPERDIEFATSLIKGFDNHGSLTERQAPWVGKLVAKIEAARNPAPTVDPVEQAVARLEAVVAQLAAKDQGFAKSLVQSFRQYGRLSEKQLHWVHELAKRATPAPAPAPAPAAQAKSEDLGGDFSRIFELFAKARESGLRFPKIRLETSEGLKVILKLLGEHSRYPGQVAVTDNGKFRQDRKYFGRVDDQGRFFPSKDSRDDVAQLLKDLATDPAKVATLYGHKTSSCCFCGLGLTTSESVSAGYGPICATKFGLPWGHNAQTTYTKIEG